jgi:hypothetical protein
VRDEAAEPGKSRKVYLPHTCRTWAEVEQGRERTRFARHGSCLALDSCSLRSKSFESVVNT